MRTETVLIVSVLLVGYSLYGGMALAGGLLTDQPSRIQGDAHEAVDTPADSAEANGTQFQFRDVSETKGFAYQYESEYTGGQSVIGNAGVYTVDYDNDGWTDVLAVGGDSPTLFENRAGEFQESDALPQLDRSYRTALFFDYDNDGWDDLLLLPKNGTPVFLENQQGEFRNGDVGLEVDLTMSMGATAGDYTGNGCLDLFIIQNGDWVNDHPDGLRNYSVPLHEDNGNPNFLFKNTCSEFVDATEEAGVQGTGWSLAASMVDFTGDGNADIHVANDYNVDVIYLNQGDGTFDRNELGDRTNRNGMSSEIVDINHDGNMDIFVTNIWFPEVVSDDLEKTSTMDIRAQGNNLLVNRGDGTFDEQADQYGVLEGGWGWAAVAADFDNDMNTDMYHTTREMSFQSPLMRYSEKDIRYLRLLYPFYRYPVFWEGTPDGLKEVNSADAGFYESDGRGVARLDFDRDGKEDLVVADANGAYRLYENVGHSQNAIQIDVNGRDGATSVGAVVHVTTADRTQTQVFNTKADFLSQDSRILHYGAGNNTFVDVRIVWPDGTEQVFTNVETGQRIVVDPTGLKERIEFE